MNCALLLKEGLERINLQHFGLFNWLVFQPARKEVREAEEINQTLRIYQN
jgi:hypothetical protein